MPRVCALIAMIAAALAIIPARSIRAASPTPVVSSSSARGEATTRAQASAMPNAQPSIANALTAVTAPVSQSAGPSAAATPAPADAAAIIAYLSGVISWYRHLAVEAQLIREPEQALFYSNDVQTANQIISLAFVYARAQVAYNARVAPEAPQAAAHPGSLGLSDLRQKSAQATAAVAAAQKRLKDLQAGVAKASASNRATLNSQIAAVQSEVELAQARADALSAMAEFVAGSSKSAGDGTGLAAQIDQLEQSVPQVNSAASKVVPQVAEQPGMGGIIGITSNLLDLQNQSESLEATIALTTALLQRVNAMRAPLIAVLQKLDQRGADLANLSKTGNLNDFRERSTSYQSLIDAHKQITATLVPLSKQQVLLALYGDNLSRWRASVDRRASQELRSLVVRLVGLLAILGLIAGGAYLWRYFTVRFVADPRRRHQLLAARRLVMWVLIVFVILLNFANQISSFATIMGFAAAGIAVALQNVILSVAGYFFLIGRFGIRAGDRVQIGSVTGDVISIGLVKLTLMELAGSDRQPTGRVVVYSNAIVFQPSGNFFKQAPGMSFVWNEVRLTLAPDCDYRLAEKRLMDAVDEVFARYRDKVQGDFRHLESDLHMLLDVPRPTSRMTLASGGLEMIIRYPAGVRTSSQVADEVTRRVLDAIRREPALKLVAPGVPNIQPIEVTEHEEAVIPDAGENGDSAVKTIAAAAERPDDADASRPAAAKAPAAKS
ncbi:MAG: mechanosensitive ion channel family protein [Candidatus Binataceae bacterium]